MQAPVWFTLLLVAHHLAVRPCSPARLQFRQVEMGLQMRNSVARHGIAMALNQRRPMARRHHFFDKSSFSAAMSSFSSARNFFSLAFSSSRGFGRVAIVARTNGATLATLGRRHPGILRLPGVEPALRHSVLAAEVRTLRPRLVLLQDANDLVFRQLCLRHRSSSPRVGL